MPKDTQPTPDLVEKWEPITTCKMCNQPLTIEFGFVGFDAFVRSTCSCDTSPTCFRLLPVTKDNNTA